MGFTSTTLMWRLAFFITLAGFLMTLAGVASSNMASCELIPNMHMHLGFWDICDETRSFSCRSLETFLVSIQDDDVDWVFGSRAVAVLSLIVQGLCPIISLYLAYAGTSEQTNGLAIGTMNILAGVLTSVGVTVFMVFGQRLLERTTLMDSDPSWSFWLLMLSILSSLVASILNFYDACTEHD